jgi:hypothetical protein
MNVVCVSLVTCFYERMRILAFPKKCKQKKAGSIKSLPLLFLNFNRKRPASVKKLISVPDSVACLKSNLPNLHVDGVFH